MAAKLQRASDRLLEEFTELQMSDIAQVAGLARSSLYYYFANKDDVLAYLLRAVLADLNATSSAAASGPGTPSERLAAVIRAQLEHLDRYSSSAQYLFANLGRAGELAEIAARVTDGYYVPVKKLLVEGAADGTFRALPDVDLGASTLHGAVLAIGLRALVTEGRIDVDLATATVGTIVWGGIAPGDHSALRQTGSAEHSTTLGSPIT